MRKPPAKFLAISFLLLLRLEPCFAQDWVKPSAGRPEYVQDRSACVQDAQSMALEGEGFDRDVVECLLSKGWQRNSNSVPVYCADKEAAISCKPGGTEEMYKRDRADCVNQMMQTVGNTYSRPGWVGLGGLIVSAFQGEENKTNLQKTQVQFMKVCLEGKNWTVELKGASKGQAEPSGNGATQPTQQTVSAPAPLANSPPPSSSNARGATIAKGITGESRYMIDAERLAKSTGCVTPVAAMNFRGAGTEQFTVACSTGDPLSIRCDDGACRLLK